MLISVVRKHMSEAGQVQPYGMPGSAVWRARFSHMVGQVQLYGVPGSAVWRARFSRMACQVQPYGVPGSAVVGNPLYSIN